MYLRTFVLINTSSESLPVYESPIESEIYSSSAKLSSFSTKHPSSNCAKDIILKILYNDVFYRIYNTYDCVASSSDDGSDVYGNTIEKVLLNTTSCEETIFCALGT